MDLKVIVSVNQIDDNLTLTDKYNLLFARAYQALESRGLVREDCQHGDHTFHTIDEYFAHLEYLYDIDRTFVMLPLGGDSFEINANKRLISNPKITVMQKDQNSTIVFFIIDRYFDYKDLATANPWVQWTLPDGVTEGATAVELTDLTIPGKIRLGWTLHDDVTAQKGNVKFSLRFWCKDEDGNIAYSFNTQTAILTITESLQPELNNEVAVFMPHDDGLFRKAVLNSNIVTENVAIPLNPRFETPGLNLNPYESLTNNALTLMAQAVSSDTGDLSYEWYYNPAEDGAKGSALEGFKAGVWYPYATVTDEDGSVVTTGFEAYAGTVGELYVKVELDSSSSLLPSERYFMLKDGEYVAYDGSTPRPTLYEKFTTYTVPTGETKVTGQYKVVAINTLGNNKSANVSSRICQLVSPDDVVFNKNGDLAAEATIPVNENGEYIDKTLSVNVVADDSNAAVRTYTWRQRKNGPNEIGTVVGSDSNSLNTKDPGWYDVYIQSTLNRETKFLTSTMCKVAYDTIAPGRLGDNDYIVMSYGDVVTSQPDDRIDWDSTADGGNGVYVYKVVAGDECVLDIDVSVNPASGYSSELYSEELSYTWGIYVAEKGFVPFTLNDVGEGKRVVDGLGTNALTVRCMADGENVMYKCIVTNSVNHIDNACSLSDALAFIVG